MTTNRQQLFQRRKVRGDYNGPTFLVRSVYYAFIFTIPFETLNIGIGNGNFTLSKMIGYFFVGVTLLQPSLCFRPPPKAFWSFASYVVVLMSWGTLLEPEYMGELITQLVTQIQMLILFWLSYNLIRYEQIAKRTLLALCASVSTLAIFQALSLTTKLTVQDRVSALGENPNSLAAVLALGLLALVGLAFGREKIDFKARLIAAICFGFLAIGFVNTGSRGGTVALVVGLLALTLRGRNVWSRFKESSTGFKLKVGLIVLVAIGVLVWISYRSEAVRVRWERTFETGSMATREKIYPKAWEMFTEKPLTGWGPIHHLYELGSRLGERYKDPHNLYLWVLNETGLLGAIPFFAGLWLCWRSAWRSRGNVHGALPLAMLICVLVVNMKGTWHDRKLFWVVLAFTLASASHVGRPRLRRILIRRNQPVMSRATIPLVTEPRPSMESYDS